jgi:lipocalin-like protein
MICRAAGALLSRLLRLSLGDREGDAGADPLRGVWRLVSYSAKDPDTGDAMYPYGARAHGYLIYIDGQRMSALVTAEGRKLISSANPSAEERAEAFSTCTAYMGTYRWKGDCVVHDVDVALNQNWVGVQQVRQARLEGNRLTLTTSPTPTPPDGKLRVGTLVWERTQ